MTETLVRAATADDLPAIERLLLDEHLPLFDVQRFIDTFWVAEGDGEITGCIGLEMYGKSALLRSIATAQSRRGTGDGHRLASRYLEEARKLGATMVYLVTMDKMGFFARYGFEACTLDDFDSDIRNCTQYQALQSAPDVVKMLTAMRLSL